MIAETTNQGLYILQFIFVGMFLVFSLASVVIYMTEQTYIFQVGTFFVWFRDSLYYQETIRTSAVWGYMIAHKDTIIPLGILLMLYKLLLSNIVNAVALSIWYNLAHIGFYKTKEDAAYRVEFHEVGGGDDHGHGHTPDPHAAPAHAAPAQHGHH